MPVYFFNSLPNDEYSNLLIVVAFYNSPFSGKTSSLLKNSYLLFSPDDKAKILAVCLFKLFVLLNFVHSFFDFLTNSHVIIGSS